MFFNVKQNFKYIYLLCTMYYVYVYLLTKFNQTFVVKI